MASSLGKQYSDVHFSFPLSKLSPFLPPGSVSPAPQFYDFSPAEQNRGVGLLLAHWPPLIIWISPPQYKTKG
jgi:hypothetical protein